MCIADYSRENLSVRNICERFNEWSEKWIKIAQLLDVPSSVISTIRVITSQQQGDEPALRKVIEWWFSKNANPKWSVIDQVLLKGIQYHRSWLLLHTSHSGQ